MRERKTISAQNKMIRLLLIFMCPLMFLLVSYNCYTIDKIKDNLVATEEERLKIHVRYVEKELDVTENYFANVISNNASFKRLNQANTIVEAHVALIEASDLSTGIYSLTSNIAGHIVYHIDTDKVKEYYDHSYSYVTKNQFKCILRENIEEDIRNRKVGWVLYEVENKFYLIRFFYLKNICLMGIYDLNLASVSQMYEEDDSEGFIFCSDGKGQPLTSVGLVKELGIEWDSEHSKSHMILGAKQRYLVVERELSVSDIYMLRARPYYGWMFADKIPLFYVLFSVFIVLLILISIWLIHKCYIIPLNLMMNTMTKVKAGDLQQRMRDDYQISEFQIVTKVFNDMLEEIQNLKIADYEQKLRLQEATMLYLQIKIRPHFVLNCLKNIFGLAQEEKYKEIQETILVLSQYLRCILKDDLHMISMEEELKGVENYILLQQISVDGSIRCEYKVENGLLSCMMPPLSIMTFVENSVKHGLETGKELLITIKVKAIKDYLYIMIMDNGKGFSQEELKYLNNKKDFSCGRRNIGIQNVLHRFFLIYEGKSTVVFSNAGGACVKIFIPLEEVEKNKDGDSAG